MAEQQIWVAGRGLQPVVKKTVPTVKASVYDPYQEMLNERAPGGYKAVKAKPKGTTTTKAYSAPAVKPKATTAPVTTSDSAPISYGIGLAGGIDADSGSALFNNNVPRGADSKRVSAPQTPTGQLLQQSTTKADGEPAVKPAWSQGLVGNNYGYVDPITGAQQSVTLDAAQLDAVQNPYVSVPSGYDRMSNGLAGMWDSTKGFGSNLYEAGAGLGEGLLETGKSIYDGLGGAQGIGTIMQGLAAYGMYDTTKDRNKMIKNEINRKNAQEDKFRSDLKASGLSA
jgi:hypothetical protein